MVSWFVLPLGLVAQAVALQTIPPARTPDTAPPRDAAVRVWLSDTTYGVGSPARLYVRLRDPGYLVVLHVDPAGLIQVLFPLSPNGQGIVPSGTFEIAATGDGQAFVIAAPGAGTVLAARTLSPMRFDGLRSGDRWDYTNALLFQPTAGNQFAALLDIAERMAGAGPYDYDLAGYRTFGTLAAHHEAPATPACPGCRPTARFVRSEPYVESVPPAENVVTNVNYAPSAQSYSVNCSNSTMVNSFCGVQDNRVWNTYQQQSYSYAEPVYIPYFVPVFERRRDSAPPPPPRPAQALTLGLRSPRTRVIPPAPLPAPRIEVRQPRAPSRPASWVNQAPRESAGAAPGAQVRIVSTMPVPAAAGRSGFPIPGLVRQPSGIQPAGAPSRVAPPAAASAGATGTALRPARANGRTGAPGALVPSRARLRTMATARR